MRKKILSISMLLLGAVLLSACSGGAVRGSSWPGLAADGNAAYLASGSLVHAVNLKDGSELWNYPEKANSKLIFYATPVITPDGLVIVGSAGTDHSLIAIDPADINPETNSPVAAWTFTGAGDHWVASPLVLGDKLFAPNSDGNLYVFDLKDGKSQKQPVKVIELGGRLWAQPVTDDKYVFVTSLDHTVSAVDIETYAVVWHKDLSAAIPGSPAIGADGMLYVGSLASQLEKFDPATGEHEPAITVKDWIWSTAVMDGDALYFGDVSGNFYSYNTSTGALNWSIKPDEAITGSAILQNDHLLLVTESGHIYAIAKNGSTLWFDTIGGQIYTTPVVSNEMILVAPLNADFQLAALNSDGRQVWKFPPGK